MNNLYKHFLKKNNKKFELSSNNIMLGINNIILSKKYDFKSPTIKLISNNIKSDIDYVFLDKKRLQLSFNVDKAREYKLYIKDGLKSETFNLKLNKEEQKNTLFFKVEEFYKKGKIYFTLISDTPMVKDYELSFEGDISKKVIWRAGETILNVNFVYQIIGFKLLNFKINGYKYTKFILDNSKFPSNLIKTKNGIRLNTHCIYDLKIKTNLEEAIIKKGNIESIINLDGVHYIQVYFKDKLLFEQYLKDSKFLPKLTITSNPLGIKLSQPYLEDVHIQLDNFDKMFTIPQGETFIEIPNKKGLMKIVIKSVENAIFDKDTYLFII